MRLNEQTIAQVKACRGVYTCGDTARHFGISKSTVSDIWNGVRHTHVLPDAEPANIKSSRVPAAVVQEDAPLLLHRGLSPNQVAQTIGISERTLYRHMNSVVMIGV